MSARRCAIYARFSTDRQNELSAEDQARMCRQFAEREGWTVAEVFSDHAISGANIRRPGLMALLAAAADARFDTVLAEDQDRVARDLEDVSGIFKRLRHLDVGLYTLADGWVDWLKIGFKGTMDALELDKLKQKIRRGQSSAVARGRIPAGLSYGYDVIREFDDRGQVDAGRRRINPEQAAIVIRIFTEYAEGRSCKAICHDLNAEGVKSPRGGEWRQSVIVGNRKRQSGILHNPIYVGRYVWNRVSMRLDPDTRNRVSRPNPEDKRQTVDIPELRIVSDELWARVQDAVSDRAGLPLVYRKRPRHLFSGLIRCGRCGGSVTVVADTRLACSRAREAGTCDNRRRLQLGDLQSRVLVGLDEKLLSPEAVSLLVREYHLERDRQLREGARSRQAMQTRLAKAEAAVANLVAAIAEGGADFADLREALGARTGERDQLRAELAEEDAAPVIALHPQIADAYRERIRRIVDAIGTGEPLSEDVRAELRSLVQTIYVHPAVDGGLDIEVIGSLDSAIAMATGRPVPKRGATLAITMVAEEGLEPPTRGL